MAADVKYGKGTTRERCKAPYLYHGEWPLFHNKKTAHFHAPLVQRMKYAVYILLTGIPVIRTMETQPLHIVGSFPGYLSWLIERLEKRIYDTGDHQTRDNTTNNRGCSGSGYNIKQAEGPDTVHKG